MQFKYPIKPLFFIVLLLCTVSCRTKYPSHVTISKSTTQKDYKTVTNLSNNIAKRPKKIVSLAPAITESLFFLKAGNRVIGVTKFCDYPDEAKEIEKIGGYIDPDLEKIISLKPDLVIGQKTATTPNLIATFKRFKIPYAFLKTETFTDSIENLLDLVTLIYNKEKDIKEIEKLNKKIKDLSIEKERLKGSFKKNISFIFIISHNPIIAASKGSFPDEILTYAGGKNVIDSKSLVTYPKIDLEILLKLNPDVIIDTTKTNDFPWKNISLRATSNNLLFHTNDDGLVRPGSRLVHSYKKLIHTINQTLTDD